MIHHNIRTILLLLVFSVLPMAMQVGAQQAAGSDGLGELVKRRTVAKAKELLSQYCKRECDLVDVVPQLTENIVETTDLGFEVDDEMTPVTSWTVEGVLVRIQMDKGVSQTDVDRLEKILRTHLLKYSGAVEIDWVYVESPRIGQANTGKISLIASLRSKLTRAVDATFKKYCPSQCILENVTIQGGMVIEEEVTGVPESQVVRSNSQSQILKLEDVLVEVALDQSLSEENREKILDVLASQLAFVTPLSLSPSVKAFPASYAQRQENLRKVADDPYGLGKLRETLILFKELAGTKEILTTVDTTQSESSTKSPIDWWLIVGGALLVILAGLFAVRLQKARQEANHMEKMAMGSPSFRRTAESKPAEQKEVLDKQTRETLEFNALKNDVLKLIVDSPKVAKETFGRLLREDGVERTSRYLHILGKVAVFDLLHDPSQRRNLLALSEYYHKSDIELTLEEKIKLLQRLKTKFTASEIKVMSRQTSDFFEFLAKLDSTQLFNLIQDESPRIQSIIMAQMGSKRRGVVFEMFNGQAKVDLLKELSQSEAIPKDYLANVAKAMQKKVKSKPEFDTENLRSNDILLDLIEKADFTAQKELMVNLEENNPESARLIKMKLVTIHMLNFLKEGHLLEIFMGMDREDLLTFLGNVDPQLARMILAKAPEDLAESWREDLQLFSQPDYSKYRVVEMQVLEKIRNLSSVGGINLQEINDLLYGTSVERTANIKEHSRSQSGIDAISANQVVA